MTVLFETETELTLGFDMEEVANTVIEGALDYLECPYEAEVNLLLTDNEGIWEVNKESRGIDRPTDVLSFPANEYEEEGDFEILEEYGEFNPDTGELVLGDILISLEKVMAQAEEYGHSVKREYAFLIVHSILHLCGFDHMEEEERARMEEKQRQIMDVLQISRES